VSLVVSWLQASRRAEFPDSFATVTLSAARVVVDRSVSSCSDDRKVINPWILVTNVTFCEKVYIARLGNLESRSTV
jgi:hypothetical protein